MATLTPTQTRLLSSERARQALGLSVADAVTAAIAVGQPDDAGMVTVDLLPWRDAITAALRELGPGSEDAAVTEAADNLLKQLSG